VLIYPRHITVDRIPIYHCW